MNLEDFKVGRGLTYQKLSEITGVSKTKIFKICKKKYDPRLGEADKIIKAVGKCIDFSAQEVN